MSLISFPDTGAVVAVTMVVAVVRTGEETAVAGAVVNETTIVVTGTVAGGAMVAVVCGVPVFAGPVISPPMIQARPAAMTRRPVMNKTVEFFIWVFLSVSG
jgi:hypothetical protein